MLKLAASHERLFTFEYGCYLTFVENQSGVTSRSLTRQETHLMAGPTPPFLTYSTKDLRSCNSFVAWVEKNFWRKFSAGLVKSANLLTPELLTPRGLLPKKFQVFSNFPPLSGPFPGILGNFPGGGVGESGVGGLSFLKALRYALSNRLGSGGVCLAITGRLSDQSGRGVEGAA